MADCCGLTHKKASLVPGVLRLTLWWLDQRVDFVVFMWAGFAVPLERRT
jgi:hypothetical protein